jgi:integrase
MVKGFFGFCESQNWISDNPARKLKRMEVKKGNRTAIFTDEQYAIVLDSVYGYEPENIPEQTRKSWQQRLTTFIELLRWSGMDLTDAVQFRPELVDKNGVLRYRRQKTDILGIVQLPERLIVLLRDIPLEQDSVGHKQPFRTNAKINSDTATWSRRLKEVFKIAGINQVRTEIGKIREPHAKMFRDTFAVSNLRRGASIYAVARMMGHSKSATTEKAYLPFVQELEKSVLDESRKVLEAFEAEAPKEGRVVQIGGRHAK